MGNSCNTAETLVLMMDSGMNICRFNMGSDDLKTHEENLDKFKEA